MKLVVLGRALSPRLALIAALIVLATAQVLGSSSSVSAQGTATIEITNLDAGTGQPLPFTRFQATSENGTVYGPLETDLNGHVTFSVTVDPQGTSFTIEEETPPACATAPEPQTTEPLAAGDSVSLSFSTQDNPVCGLGTIALYAMACPERFSGPADSYEPWRDGCAGTSDGTEFTLTSSASGESWNPVAGAYGIPGRAPVVGLPAGDYSIQQNGETPSAVFCLVYDTANYATSPQPSSVLPIELTDGIGTISLDGNRVSCDVFTVPGGAVAQPTATADVQPASGATLDIHLAACPPGYPAGNSIYDDCHGNGIADQPVQLSSTNGFAGAIATSFPATPGPGVASFTGLADGTYTIAIDNGANKTIYTYCSNAIDDEVISSFDSAASTLTIDIASGDALTCDWYVSPPVDSVTSLQITHFSCPGEFDPDSSNTFADFSASCGEPVNGPDLTLEPQGAESVTLATGSSGVGTVLFEALPSGNYGLGTSYPGEFNTPWIFCGIEGSDLQLLPESAYPLAIDATAGTYVCAWFDVGEDARDGSPTITITSYLCPAGTSANFADACGAAPLPDTRLQLTADEIGPVIEVTDNAGVAVFTGLDSKIYRIAAFPPEEANVAVYVVDCTAGGESYPFEYDDSNGLDILIEVGGWVEPDGYPQIACDWYNVPPAEPTVSPSVVTPVTPSSSGAITVHKFLCEGKSIDSYNWDTDCTTETVPVGFSLKSTDGRPIAVGSTDTSGVLKYTNLANGAYSLDETSGDWCHAEADRVDSAGNVLVANGGNTDVFIYNCSLSQVGTLPSTGTGSVSAAPAAGFDSDKRWQLVLAAVATLGIALAVRHRLQRAAVGLIQSENEVGATGPLEELPK